MKLYSKALRNVIFSWHPDMLTHACVCACGGARVINPLEHAFLLGFNQFEMNLN